MRRQLLLLALITPLLVASSPVETAAQTPEAVTIYADDCRTPKTVFLLGEVVCARAESFPIFPSMWRERRFQWAAPRGVVAQEDDIKSDPEYAYYKIPTTASFPLIGTWTVKTINVDSDGYAVGRFTVRHPLSVYANLELIKTAPTLVQAGTKVSHRVYIYNDGPDPAERVTLTETIPNDMFFLGVRQASGPLASCKTPASGEGGQIICTFSGLGIDDKVDLQFVYGVSDFLRDGWTLTGTSEVSSLTEELDKRDNFYDYEGTIYTPPTDQPCTNCEPQ